jgi:hypothetical protein
MYRSRTALYHSRAEEVDKSSDDFDFGVIQFFGMLSNHSEIAQKTIKSQASSISEFDGQNCTNAVRH